MNQAETQQFSEGADTISQADEGAGSVDQNTREEIVDDSGLPQISEFDMLKMRAKNMGITHSGNIGIEALRAKIQAKLDGEPEAKLDPVVSTAQVPQQFDPALNPLAGDRMGEKPVTKMTLREQVRKEALQLIRCRITNMDPKKKDLAGEVFAVGNKYTGLIRKFVPYGEATDDGYHLPKILYDELSERRFQNIRTFKDRKTNQQRVETNWVREFAIDVLPQLTAEDLAVLANAQAAAGSIDKN